MLPDYDQMNGKQKWAINKLGRVTKNLSARIICFYFAEISSSEPTTIDLKTLGYIPNYGSDRPDTKKAKKKRLLKGLQELENLGLVKNLDSHNWAKHTATITPLENLTAKLRGK